MENELKTLFMARLIISGIPIHDAPKIAGALVNDVEITTENHADGECVMLTEHFEFCPFCDQEIY